MNNIAYCRAIDDARRGLQTARAAVDAARAALVGKPWPSGFLPASLSEAIDDVIKVLPQLPCTDAEPPVEITCTSKDAT